jgi:hypothetical protein
VFFRMMISDVALRRVDFSLRRALRQRRNGDRALPAGDPLHPWLALSTATFQISVARNPRAAAEIIAEALRRRAVPRADRSGVPGGRH